MVMTYDLTCVLSAETPYSVSFLHKIPILLETVSFSWEQQSIIDSVNRFLTPVPVSRMVVTCKVKYQHPPQDNHLWNSIVHPQVLNIQLM